MTTTQQHRQAPGTEPLAVYALAVQRGGVTAGDPGFCAELGIDPEELDRALAELRELHLLRRDTDGGHGRLVPVRPEVAGASLISPVSEQIYRLQAEISQIQGRITVFQDRYEAHSRPAQPPQTIESLRSEAELSGQLYLAAARCASQFAGFRPDGPLGLKRVAEMASRGIAVRLLLQHSARADLRARPVLQKIIQCGGEIRTTGRTPRQVIIFDDELAFLIGERDAEHAGVLIRHPETVSLLCGVIEMTWAAAEPYSAGEIGYREVTDDMQRTVIELLASGLTDEAIARRLGVSVRTCRRHIATVLTRLEAVSRFQAGALAASNNLLDTERLRALRGRPSQLVMTFT